MARVRCYYYKIERGKIPVQQFIDSLSYTSQTKFFAKVQLLERFGYKLTYPHVKPVGEKIYELRFLGEEGNIRILYFFFSHGKVLFTNGFIKKTNKLPRSEFDLAVKRRKHYLEKGKVR